MFLRRSALLASRQAVARPSTAVARSFSVAIAHRASSNHKAQELGRANGEIAGDSKGHEAKDSHGHDHHVKAQTIDMDTPSKLVKFEGSFINIAATMQKTLLESRLLSRSQCMRLTRGAMSPFHPSLPPCSLAVIFSKQSRSLTPPLPNHRNPGRSRPSSARRRAGYSANRLSPIDWPRASGDSRQDAGHRCV